MSIWADALAYMSNGLESTDQSGGSSVRIRSISPNQGALVGGNSAVIVADGLSVSGNTCTIGGNAATVLLENATQITVTVPAGSALGRVDVTVANATANTDVWASAYEYVSVSGRSVSARVTARLLEKLRGLTFTGTGKTAQLVEQERTEPDPNGRYPYIIVSGPDAQIQTTTHQVAMTELQYTLLCFWKQNDRSQDNGTEITYITADAHADLIRAVMTDPQQTYEGVALAHKTEISDYGYYWAGDDDAPVYAIYIVVNVLSRVDGQNPYVLN